MSETSQIILGPVPHFKNEWAQGTTYKKGAIVFHNGSSFVALVAGPTAEPSFSYDSATGTWTVSTGWGLLAVGAGSGVSTDLAAVMTLLGYRAEQSTIQLTAGETGKYVKCSTRAAVANVNFNISEPFDVDACAELLIKTGYNPSDANHASLDISVIAIYEEIERTRVVQKKDGNNAPLYYVVVVDPETGSETVTDQETTTNTGYPVYVTETYTEQRYLPNNEDRFVQIPDSGYYIANIPQSCKCVISYKPGVTDMQVVVMKHGALANLTSQIFGIYEHRTMAEAVAAVEARVEALEAGKDKLGNATAGTIDVEGLSFGGYPLKLRGHGAPSASVRPVNLPDGLPWDGVPPSLDHTYTNLDAASGGLWYPTGVNSVSDWKQA